MNKIVYERETRGTETSKYPEEEKETSIFLVAASERERGQTEGNALGVADTNKDIRYIAEAVWKGIPKRVKVPYAKCSLYRSGSRVPPDT